MKKLVDPTKCPITITTDPFYLRPCGRALPEGADVCKLHLEHRRRAAVRNAELEARYAAHKARADRNDDLATTLFKLLDGQATVGFSGTHILLTPQAAELLIEKLTTTTKGA